MIADVTDFDTDMMGDHIMYYLGGEGSLERCIVEGREGLEHHEIELSDIANMLKYETLSNEQRNRLADITGGTYPKELMNSMRI